MHLNNSLLIKQEVEDVIVFRVHYSREFQQRRRRRKRDNQNSNRFIKQNNRFARASVASVASVSSRVRRESWDDSKKNGLTGDRRGRLAPALTFAQLDWKRLLRRLVDQAFLYISQQLLHDYDVKMPNFTFYGGRLEKFAQFCLLQTFSANQNKREKV